MPWWYLKMTDNDLNYYSSTWLHPLLLAFTAFRINRIEYSVQGNNQNHSFANVFSLFRLQDCIHTSLLLFVDLYTIQWIWDWFMNCCREFSSASFHNDLSIYEKHYGMVLKCTLDNHLVEKRMLLFNVLIKTTWIYEFDRCSLNNNLRSQF